MKKKIIARWIAVGILAVVLINPAPDGFGQRTTKDLLVGVKIYDAKGDLKSVFAEWVRLGINTVFASPVLESNQEFRSLAKKNGVATFIIVPIFYNAEGLDKHPDLYAVTAQGQKASEEWVKFVCPTRQDYRSHMVDYVKRLVRDYDPDGISLDFIRYFVFWEKVYADRTLGSLPQTCFEASCLAAFEKATGLEIPLDLSETSKRAQWIIANHLEEWTDFKCAVIAGMVKDLAEAAKKIKPSVKINIHIVPWRREDFGGAIRIIAAQDLARIAPLVDYLSPMCYHHMLLRDPAWIHSVVDDVSDWTQGQVLPSIQVDKAYIEAELSASEFKAALAEALKPPSRGVVFWNWDTLDKSSEKKDAVEAALTSKD